MENTADVGFNCVINIFFFHSKEFKFELKKILFLIGNNTFDIIDIMYNCII